jgi:hypothetical protein
VQQARIPLGAGISGQDRLPDGVDPHDSVRVGIQEVLLEPTGPGEADGSSRRQKNDESRHPRRGIE